MIGDNTVTGEFTVNTDVERELCNLLEQAICGGIKRDNLINHGSASTPAREAEARSRFDTHMESDLSDFINDL